MTVRRIAHLIYRFDVGGLERVMINCINQLPEHYEHVVIALTEVSDFQQQLDKSVATYQLDKKPGADLSIHWRLFKLLKKLNIDCLHTYNLATIEYHPIARLAGIKHHLHAEHGRDIHDPQGLNKKHNMLRYLMQPFIQFYVPVSADLHQWLAKTVGIKPHKNKLIYNGIDTDKFHPTDKPNADIYRFGTLARLSAVKDQATLLKAFALLVKQTDQPTELVVIGNGPEMQNLKALSEQLGITQQVRFLGQRNDVVTQLQQLDVFVLSSIAEGIPMTILEAMACQCPIISTAVGGIPEILQNEQQGILVEVKSAQQMADAMAKYLGNPALGLQHGQQGRKRVIECFSENAMIDQYDQLYQAGSK